MKKIGFVDYYISEWHANNYPAWIEKVCGEMNLDYTVAYAWAEEDVSPRDGVTTDEWCAKFGVEKCETLAELCEKSDAIVILAPTDPEKHLGYAETVLPYGKATYIDKTFAPDLATAEKIYAIAGKYGTPIFSTSALRYASELEGKTGVTNLTLTGGGSSLSEYFVHLGEMVIKTMGVGVQSVSAVPHGTQWILTAEYGDGRRAVMIYGEKMPHSAYITDETGESWTKITSPFFEGLLADMIRFFETKTPSFDPAETLEVIRLRDMVLAAVGK